MNLKTTMVASAVLCCVGAGLLPCQNFSTTARIQPPNSLQSLIAGPQEYRRDFPCSVTLIKPDLGFDFAFHSGYDVVMPVNALVNAGNELNIVLKISKQDSRDNVPYYGTQKVPVPIPSVQMNSKGNAEVRGYFLLGEGRYHVEWGMTDQRSRACTSSWDFETKVPPKHAAMSAWIQTAAVQGVSDMWFDEKPHIDRVPQAEVLGVDIIVNFAPQHEDSVTLDGHDLECVIAMLRRIVSDPHIGSCSVVACSLATQQVLYRQENAADIDFPALGAALNNLHLGLVDVKDLAANSPEQFAANLVNEQSRKRGRDALLIIGPNTGPTSTRRQILETVKDLDRPVFYLSYNAEPLSSPWRDLIGNLVRHKHGVEYTITQPEDLFKAWSEIISRIAQTRHTSSNK